MTLTLDFAAAATDSHTRRALTDLSLSVAKSKKIVVVTGAGISCSCGIPDFRSSDGLYALVKQQYPDVVLRGRDLFDASLFRDPTSTAVFYAFIAQLKRAIDKAAPTPTHRFVRTLDTKHKLLRSYTQNIDGLEERTGLVGSASEQVREATGKRKIRTKDVRNVQLHGDIHRVRCTFCSAESVCTEEHLRLFTAGTPPNCPECLQRSEARVARSARALKIGTLRPAIVLYDEPHPLGDDIGAIQTADLARKPDMLVIMGTSLKVHGLKKLVKDFARAVHAGADTGKKPWAGKVVYVNRTPPAGEWAGIIDVHVQADTDSWVERVVEDWKKMRPADWEVQQTLDGVESPGAAFRSVKEAPRPKPVGGKKENRRPFDAFAAPPPSSSPAPSTCTSPLSSPPSSPSKRRQTTSHYSALESSPSKKRGSGSGPAKAALHPEERGMLFGDSTNMPADMSIDWPSFALDKGKGRLDMSIDGPSFILDKPTKGKRKVKAIPQRAGKAVMPRANKAAAQRTSKSATQTSKGATQRVGREVKKGAMDMSVDDIDVGAVAKRGPPVKGRGPQSRAASVSARGSARLPETTRALGKQSTEVWVEIDSGRG